MKNIFATLAIFCVISTSNCAYSAYEFRDNIFLNDICETTLASYSSSHISSGVMELVTFTNTSSGYYRSEWFLNDSLVATTNHFSYSFSVSGNYVIKLKVFSVGDICNSESVGFHFVSTDEQYCGNLILPDQSASECECMTSYNVDSLGQMISETNYRWADRWGNKYCNLSIAGNCEDNLPFSTAPVTTPSTANCQAGYFNLYFNDAVIGGTNYSIPTNQREIICQVFADFSELITRVNPSILVNFKVSAMFDPMSNTIASAGSFYDINPAITNAIIHGEVWKAINSGSNDPSLFDGMVNINLAKIFYVGYNDIANNSAPNQYDLYAIIQHELMHALGFASLITNYSGASFFTSNNLYSSFDEHLKTSGSNVLINSGPGINYTFNTLGNNCTNVKFNNQGAQQSPVNSYQINGGGSGITFNSPSHFDDACTNNSNSLYVMHPSISANQQRRLQQEEVNALVKMGYVTTTNYGTATLLVNSSVINPNQITLTAGSGTGTGFHLAANDDILVQPFTYYTTDCADQNVNGSYVINILGNDNIPPNTTIVDLKKLSNGLTASFVASTTGFTFAPSSEGLYEFQYRLLHISGAYSNYAIVTIRVDGCSEVPEAGVCNEFPGPNNCDFLCNNELQKSNYSGTGFTLPGPVITSNPMSPYFFEGWESFAGSPDWFYWNANPTNFNLGKSLAIRTYPNQSESFGQDVQLAPNVNYILSYYHRKVFGQPANGANQVLAGLVNTASFPIGSFNNQGLMTIWPPPSSQDILISPVIPTGDVVWRQYVSAFTPNTMNDYLYIYGTSLNSAYAFFDNIELIEDNFPVNSTVQVPCSQPIVIGDPDLCQITNMQYSWFEVASNGTEIGPLSFNTTFSVTTNVNKTYRLKRTIIQNGSPGNNGYEVVNSSVGALNSTDLTPFEAQADYNIVVTFPPNNSYAIEPEFNVVTSYCMNSVIPNLPTTSSNLNNPISGTWSPPVMNNQITTQYTFTPTISPGQCISQKIITITITDCGSCNTAPGSQISGTLTNVNLTGNYRVVGDLFISGNVSMNNCVLAIEPNITINVGSSDMLNLTGSHLYGCHTLWNGIVVQPQGKFYASQSSYPVVQSTLIEGAKVAVDVKEYYATAAAPNIRIHKTIFNRNNIGIRINRYPYNDPNYAFNLMGNVFTQRDVSPNPAVWPLAANLISPNPLASNLNSEIPRINTNTYLEMNLQATLLPNGIVMPNNQITAQGILLMNVGLSNATGDYPLTIGGVLDTDPFVFDRMLYGINAYSSVVEVKHAYFQAPSGLSNTSIGIRTNSTIPVAFSGLLLVDGTAKPVQFYNLKRAIDVLNYTKMTVKNTRIRSNRTSSTNLIGEIGIRYQSLTSNSVVITNNLMHNVDFGVLTMLGSPSVTNILLNISHNEILRNIAGGSLGLITTQGIQVERNPSTTGSFTSTNFNIDNNNIRDVRRGISVTNITAQRMLINDNWVEIRESAPLVGSSTTANYWGIRLLTVSSSPINNVLPAIQSNIVDGSSFQSNLQVRAIMLMNSNKFIISCNDLRNTGSGFYFSGYCPNTLRQNILYNHRFGLWLESANIGAQGVSGNPSDNVWSGVWNTFGGYATISNSTTRIKTYVSGNSSSLLSPLRVRNTTLHNPNNSWARENPTNIQYSTATGGLVLVTGPTPQACNMNGIYPPGDSLEIALQEEAYINALEESTTTLDSLALLEASEVIREMTLYENLDIKPELMDSSVVLEDFYDDRSEENIGKLREMDKQLEEKNLIEAALLRDQIDPENTVEWAYKTVLSLLLENENSTFTSADSADLLYWANSCSYIYGKATSMAQSAYNSIYRECMIFSEDCAPGLGRGASLEEQGKNQVTRPKLQLTLFPNPSKDYLYVRSSDVSITEASCTIRGLDGREIYSGIFDFENGLSLSNLSMATGVYIIEFNVDASKEIVYQQFTYLK
jgi:hypothetical protein